MVIGIQQRVLPLYRRPFFEKLASVRGLTLSVFAGQPLPHEEIHISENLEVAYLRKAGNHYWNTPSGFVCWQSGLATWLQEFNPEVLIVEANPRVVSTWIAITWMRRRKRPVLGWGLGELPRSGPSCLRRARHVLARVLVKNLDGMIAYSSKAARDYMAAGVPEVKILVAYNAIDNQESERYLAQHGSNIGWITPWKEALELDPLLPIILFVGRLLPQKRVDLLIQACAPLFHQCQLLIVGDGPARHEFETYSQPYRDRVRFVGHQSGAMLAKCFIASDIFVLPGAGGLALHQAMSYGKPVIASFGDGTEADLIREGVNGAFVRLGDATDLTQKIRAFLNSPNQLREMGRASLSIIRNEMSLDVMVAVFVQALHTAMQGLERDAG